jgi:hypothetical protein
VKDENGDLLADSPNILNRWKNYYSQLLNVHRASDVRQTLMEEHRLRMFENRVLRRIFGTKKDEETGGWRKLHNEELLNSSQSIIIIIKSRRMRWAGHVERMGEKRNAYRILVGKPEGKRPLVRPRRRWVDNIKMDLREMGWEWIGLIWLRIGTSGGLL